MKALAWGFFLASLAVSGSCGPMLPEAAIGAPDAAAPFEFVWDAAPEPPAAIIREVPEPSGWLMLLCGIGALVALHRRRPPLFE